MRAVLLAMVDIVCASWMLAAPAGCTEPRSAACKEVCKREAECVDVAGNKIPFDEKECIAACAALEHDVEHSAAKVARHIDCVNKQQTCAAVLECK
jgi:cytochrome c556